MAMKDYKMTACLKKKRRNVAPQPAEFLASISARYCFDIWGLGYSCFIFCIFMRFEKPCSALRFLNTCLFSSNLYANEVPFVMVRCSLTVLINENYYYCTFNLSSF